MDFPYFLLTPAIGQDIHIPHQDWIVKGCNNLEELMQGYYFSASDRPVIGAEHLYLPQKKLARKPEYALLEPIYFLEASHELICKKYDTLHLGDIQQWYQEWTKREKHAIPVVTLDLS